MSLSFLLFFFFFLPPEHEHLEVVGQTLGHIFFFLACLHLSHKIHLGTFKECPEHSVPIGIGKCLDN